MGRVGIIIVNWNGYDDTCECVDSLSDIEYRDYQIYLVDNASKGNDVQRLRKRYSRLRIVENTVNNGFAKANNQGVKAAIDDGCEYILLLNNDTLVTKDFLGALVDVYQSNKDFGVLGTYIAYYPKVNTVWFGGGKELSLLGTHKHIDKGKNLSETSYSLTDQVLEVDFISGCCLFSSVKMINRVGMLDEEFFAYYVDVEWCLRVKKIGKKLGVVSNALIYHKKSSSAGVKGSNNLSNLQVYLMTRNSWIYAKRLKGILKLQFMFGLIFARSLYMFVYSKGWRGKMAYWRGLTDGIITKDRFWKEYVTKN